MPNKFLLNILYGGFKVIYREEVVPFIKEDIKNILIINTTAIGDTLLSTPAIRAIREGFPDARIAVLASPQARMVLKNNPRIDYIIEHPGRVDFFYIFKLPALIRRLRRGRFDLVVILHANDPDAAPLAYLSGAPHRMGWAESRLSFLHTVPVKTRLLDMHTIDVRLRNLEEIGIVNNNRRMEMFITDDESEWASRFIRDIGSEDTGLIGIHPFGSKQNKWWHKREVMEFCSAIREEFGFAVLLFGGNKEREAAGVIADEVDGVVNLSGRCDIRETVALIDKCRVFVSTDSGPMHIAHALGVPTVALFGPDDPRITGPLLGNFDMIQLPLPCVPCRSKECHMESVRCMEIDAEKVMRAVKSLLHGTEGVERCSSL